MNDVYLISCKDDMGYSRVRELVDDFFENRMGGRLDYFDTDGESFIGLGLDENHAVVVRIGEKYSIRADDSYEIVAEVPAIAFHKTSAIDFVWWIYIELQNHIARALGGEIVDEGVGELLSPHPPRTFREYMREVGVVSTESLHIPSEHSSVIEYFAKK